MFAWKIILVIVEVFTLASGYPIDPKDVTNATNNFAIIAIGVVFLLSFIFILFACTCCRERRDGFKEFTNTSSLTNVGFTNALATEVSIFPPPGAVGSRQSPVPAIQVSGSEQPSRPAGFSSTIPDISDWFVDANADFPRQQLFYQKEIGKGWFGKVVEGEACGSKVIVRILREDATNEEKAYFLHEARPYRDLQHKNVTRLFGRCLQFEPYLLLFELYSNGDLKSFLCANNASRKAINEQGISLKMMADVCEGVKHMNQHGFIHTDLAARNCLVTSDLTVKIGDYGTSVDLYKNEYYIAGNVAVPIRWCAPETLHCTTTTIETKQVTETANVWSLAVVLWEIAEFGKLPYTELTDEQVIVRVHGEEKYRLPQPDCPYGHYLYNIMQICWRSENRATIDQVLSMLYYLKSNPFQESDFESRWKKLKPNTVPVVDNHTPIHSPRHTELAQRPHLQTKSEFDSGVDLEIKPSDDNSCKTGSPMTISPQLSVTSEDIFQSTRKKSPSLTNLQGSLEDVSSQFDSWLQGVETKTDEDRTFARSISEAIKNLDETLALEKTSSSSSRDSSLECQNKPLLDFKIGLESIQTEKKSESSSDTEEETWRHRIERGEFTEKVKEKSKSVTDLMVLTHIDSEESESDSLPSLTRQYSMKKNGGSKAVGGSGGGATYTSIGFGSEGNIRNAIISEELQEKLKALTLWKTDDHQSFLGKRTSDTNQVKNNQIFLDKQTTSTNKAAHELGSHKLIGETSLSSDSSKEIFVENKNDSQILFLELEVCNELTANSCVRGSKMPNKLDECNMESVNTASNVNNVASVNISENLDNVNNKACTEQTETLLSAKDHNRIIIPSENKELTNCTNSSQKEEDSVPKIVITESEIIMESDEPEVAKEAEICFNFKPRKFVFVCKDPLEEVNIPTRNLEISSPQGEKEEEEDEDLVVDLIKADPEQSTVILGSCEDYTLDYFKGLKTTFSPTEQYSDEESDLKESSSTKEDTVRQLTDPNDDSISPSRDDSATHNVTDDCISPLRDDPIKPLCELLLDDGPTTFDETELTVGCKSKIQLDVLNPCENLRSEDILNLKSNSVDTFIEDVDFQNLPPNLPPPDFLDLSATKECINICNIFIKEEMKYYCQMQIDSIGGDNDEFWRDNAVPIDCPRQAVMLANDACGESISNLDLSILTDKNKFSFENDQNTAFVNAVYSDALEISDNKVSSVDDKALSCKNISGGNVDYFKSASANKVSKSKSLESVLCNKSEENVKFLSNSSISEYVPGYVVSTEVITEDIFQKPSLNCDSYFSVDSGHGSERYGEHDRHMDDLKNRLEEVVKYGEDYQLHSSEDEYGGKLLTPDDERSSDSGFRDKGSLSESVEDTCDEKYNLEDIDAELEDFSAAKGADKEEVKYYEHYVTAENESVATVQNIEGWFLHPQQKQEPHTEQQNGWVPLSTEYEEKHPLIIDDEFVTAIRNELKEKLPCAMLTQKTEEDNSPELEYVDPSIQFSYPAQLSPILEEQESNQSSLLVDDSPVLIIPPPEVSLDPIGEIFSKTSDPSLRDENDIDQANEESQTIIVSNDKFSIDEDVIIVDTETNEVTLIESPKPPSSFSLPRTLSDNFKDDDSVGINSETYVLSPDNAPLTPDLSTGSNTLSSPAHGNISGMCISPNSIKSDLFDSGPPSLPFDLGQSLEDVEELPLTNKPIVECFEIPKDIKSLDVRKDDGSDFSSGNLIQESENPEMIAANVVEVIDGVLKEVSDKNKRLTYSFLRAERGNEMLQETFDTHINPVICLPQLSEVDFGPSDDSESTIIAGEVKSKEKGQDEVESIDVDLVDQVKPSCSFEQSKWLQDLLLSSSINKDELESFNNKFSVPQNWPTNNELISPTNNDEKCASLRPSSINSTLALMSPDLSSTDSKSHSLLSSFASTPSDDQKQFIGENSSRASAPSSLSISSVVINVPMPSPEDADKEWRPTICQLMELTDQAEGEEMTTSFIEPDENGIYTPDWESDASEEQTSSSSGEFVWKEGDGEDMLKGVSSDNANLLQEPLKMERIEEEEEDNVADVSYCDDNSSEGSGTEFIPSTWNASATPVKSAIKSPETPLMKSEKKKVVFKKEKYQCIYEYPREPSDDEDGPDPWQTPSVAIEYSPFHDFDFGEKSDWERGEDEVIAGAPADGGGYSDDDSEDQHNKQKNCSDIDFYKLPYSIDPHNNLLTDDGDFFISSSSEVSNWWTCGDDDEDGGDSEFFPGRDSLEFSPIASELTPLNLGELRHTKDSLRLELPLIARTEPTAITTITTTTTTTNSTLDSGIDISSPLQQLQQQQQQLSPQKQMSCAQQSAREDRGEAALLDEQPALHTNK